MPRLEKVARLDVLWSGLQRIDFPSLVTVDEVAFVGNEGNRPASVVLIQA
jgi:hypothetical protein